MTCYSSWRDRPAIVVYEQLNPPPPKLTWEPVDPSAPGWRHVWLNTPPLHLLVHAHVNEGIIRITRVLVTGQALDATQLISVPLGRIAKIIALISRPLPGTEAWTVRPAPAWPTGRAVQ